MNQRISIWRLQGDIYTKIGTIQGRPYKYSVSDTVSVISKSSLTELSLDTWSWRGSSCELSINFWLQAICYTFSSYKSYHYEFSGAVPNRTCTLTEFHNGCKYKMRLFHESIGVLQERCSFWMIVHIGHKIMIVCKCGLFCVLYPEYDNRTHTLTFTHTN